MNTRFGQYIGPAAQRGRPPTQIEHPRPPGRPAGTRTQNATPTRLRLTAATLARFDAFLETNAAAAAGLKGRSDAVQRALTELLERLRAELGVAEFMKLPEGRTRAPRVPYGGALRAGMDWVDISVKLRPQLADDLTRAIWHLQQSTVLPERVWGIAARDELVHVALEQLVERLSDATADDA